MTRSRITFEVADGSSPQNVLDEVKPLCKKCSLGIDKICFLARIGSESENVTGTVYGYPPSTIRDISPPCEHTPLRNVKSLVIRLLNE